LTVYPQGDSTEGRDLSGDNPTPFIRSLPTQGFMVETPEDAMNDTIDAVAKILLAEDDNDMRRFLVKALQNAGYNVASFDNGLSAYNRLREEPFELLLTDIVMPEMDGIELARRATELDPDIKVMFITGFAAVALNPDNNAPKDAKILSKPFHLKELVSEVQRLLAA
jgi:two-component system cell cycle response regulator CpdR